MKTLRSASLVLVTGLLVMVTLALSVQADDRALLNAQSGEPYVFVLFDTSGSMHWTPFCSQADFDAGECAPLCTVGNCNAWTNGDDPVSKLYQAKKVLYETVESATRVHFGFATYNQDDLGVLDKHWIYKPRTTGIELVSGNFYPDPDFTAPDGAQEWQEIFGDRDSCTSSSRTGCDYNRPADMDDAWELERVWRYPKIDDDLNDTVSFYVRDTDNRTYRVYYSHASGYGSETMGSDTIHISVRVRRYNISNGNYYSSFDRTTVVPFDLVYTDLDGDGTVDAPTEFLMWENGARRGPRQRGYTSTDDLTASGTCDGWDPNNPVASVGGLRANDDDDFYGSYRLRFPSQTADFRDVPTGNDLFLVGDVVPFDWLNDQRQTILDRLAPNRVSQGSNANFIPDFGSARYLNDLPVSGRLTLKDTNERPIISTGSTPIGYSVRNFDAWYADWRKRADGTISIPGGADESFGCRRKFLLVLTDGEETCGNSPCDETRDLFDDQNVQTFVVGYGLQNSTTLNCMPWFFPLEVEDDDLRCRGTYDGQCYDCPQADLQTRAHPVTGETVPVCREPFFAASASELKDALSNIIQLVSTETRSFSSAAVPSVQAEEADKIYLSSFVPTLDSPIWPGRMDAFLRPLPLKEVVGENGEINLIPDASIECSSSVESSCHLWNVNDPENYDTLLDQLPAAAQSAVRLTNVTAIQAALNGMLDYGDASYDDSDFQSWLGAASSKRRVLYARQDGATGVIPAETRLFLPPVSSLVNSDELWRDLIRSLEICTFASDTHPCYDASTAQGLDARDAVRRTQRFTIMPKVIRNPQNGEVLPFVMGDIFHSDPVVVSSPSNFQYFTEDIGADSLGNGGYRDYVLEHRTRRRLLVVGSNDGQLHVFEAGTYSAGLDDQGNLTGDYTNGTGKELFSFVPRGVKPTLEAMSQPGVTDHRFTVDGTVRVDDIYLDPVHTGTPTASEREWRTLLIGGLREGGKSYYALDVTQPDVIDFQVVGGVTTKVGEAQITTNSEEIPTCYGVAPGGTCGPVPFPAVLWEFSDPLDEDGVGGTDLGDTWSRPNTGRVRICTAGTCNSSDAGTVIEDRYVAIFGGGMDASRNNQEGNWLYMLDIETGEVIWKVPLIGSAPSEPAAVDTDGDGYLDTIYIGTTLGYLYKADISKAVKIVSTTVPDAVTGTLVSVDRVTDSAWDPFLVFTTGGQPIFYPPAVIYIPDTGHYALAFGVGDREDLWSSVYSPSNGRFYMIVDNGFAAGMTPRVESDYPKIIPNSNLPNETNLLLTSPGGWYMELDSGRIEHLITPPFAISGITVFSTYLPGDAIGEGGSVCGRTGSSRLYVVFTTNANGVMKNSSGTTVRYREVSDLVTSPFVQEGTTKNKRDPNAPTVSPCDAADVADIQEILKQQLPDSCTFGNFSQDILTRRSREGIECIAPVPVCMIQHNWREF